MSSQQKKQQQTLTQTASYNTAVIATVLSGVHTVLTWYQCTKGVMQTPAGRAIGRAKSAIGSAATGAKTAIGSRFNRTSALGGGAEQNWAYEKWYWRVSIIVLLLIFIMSIISHRYVEQHPEDTNPNSWADTFYTCILSILAVLVSISLTGKHIADVLPGTVSNQLGCETNYHYAKIGLLLLLTFFTGAVAADRQAHKTA